MRMKKIFTFLCAALMTLSAVQAEVLFTEHFAQTTETLATNTDALPYSGEIAATGWTNIMGGSGDIYMNTSSDLTYTGYKSKKDDTGSAEFKASYGRRVAAALSKEVNSGSVFMAGIEKLQLWKVLERTIYGHSELVRPVLMLRLQSTMLVRLFRLPVVVLSWV